ncbi:MAG: hypothetical protein IJ832_04905 [Bacteroidaceae bacterium]|nr:hypothetical protein [Bacteroidaceae bacterium]
MKKMKIVVSGESVQIPRELLKVRGCVMVEVVDTTPEEMGPTEEPTTSEEPGAGCIYTPEPRTTEEPTTFPPTTEEPTTWPPTTEEPQTSTLESAVRKFEAGKK